MQRGAQRRQFRLRDILQLVDDHEQGGVRRGRCGAEGLEQRHQVEFEIAAVGHTRFDRRADTQLDVAVLHFERRGKTGKNSERSCSHGAHAALPGHTQQGAVQLGGEQRRQWAAVAGLDHYRSEPCLRRPFLRAAEHHRLADTAQAEQQDASRRQLPARAFGGDMDGIE